MDIVDLRINDYLQNLTPPRPAIIAEMEEYAAEIRFPIIGPQVGHFLQQLVVMTSAKRIFEMGSGFGYSALWMAMVLPEGGTVTCTDSDPKSVKLGKSYARRSGLDTRIIWQTGDGLELMKQASGEFDLIMNDVDKEQYPESLKAAWPKLRVGGVMITDNVLWSGRVVAEQPPKSATAGILEFNRLSYQIPDALCSLIPLRDGLFLAVKRSKPSATGD